MTKKNSERDRITGIYMITNLINGKIYIGQSVDICERFRCHKIKDKKDNTYLYNAFEKYGASNFRLQILIRCSYDRLDYYEIACIAEYNSCDRDIGYNRQLGGRGVGSGLHSEETKLKMSASAKANKWTDDHRENVINSNKSRVWSDKQKNHMAEIKSRENLSAETRRNMSEGNKSSWTDERRAATAAANKARVWSDESRKKVEMITLNVMNNKNL